MDVLDVLNTEPNSKIDTFRSGDTVRVNFQVREGDRVRVQAFEGVVIRSRGGGSDASFTVRRVTYGMGVERVFPLNSPLLESLQVVRKGDVRQSRLYYLRGRFGRAARIKERT